MKAIIQTTYGSPSLLQYLEVEDPSPQSNEIRIKVKATAVNDYDWSKVTGKPGIYKLMFGLTKPKNQIPGMEVAGVVDVIGEGVTTFNVGDAVYGDTSEHSFGTFADYLCVPEAAVVKKPESMSFEEAAALSHAANLAWQGLVDLGQLQDGMDVLINGGGGGVGVMGLQLAKLKNCKVTGVDTGEKLKMMGHLGFDKVVDYQKTDFTRQGIRYDIILDCKTNRSPFSYLKALKPGGKYITVGGYLLRLLQGLISKPFIPVITSKSYHIVALKTNKDLEAINRLYIDGKLKPVIDGPYPLAEAGKWIQYFGDGLHTGKVILVP